MSFLSNDLWCEEYTLLMAIGSNIRSCALDGSVCIFHLGFVEEVGSDSVSYGFTKL
jgi:hypothetical protein